MRRVAWVLLFGLWLVAAEGVAALVLGDIEVGSLRGEPLLARIPLSDLPANAEQELAVRLGGEDEFARAGLEHPPHLDSLQFRVVAEGEEPAHVLIAGRDPIDTPSVSLLIEGVWSGGRVLREYTLVLDAAPPQPAGTYGPVRAVDTLWSLAGRFRPEGISVQRMMLAMLARNPHAFTVDNVNALREGATLRIPALDRIGSDEKTSAMEEVRRQNDAWQVHLRLPVADDVEAVDVAAEAAAVPADEEPAPAADAQPLAATGVSEASEAALERELRVVAPGTGESTSAADERNLRAELDVALEEVDTSRRELSEMSTRLDEAERLIVDLQRLVELKDDDIAGLQLRLAAEADAAAEARRNESAQEQVAAQAQAEARAQTEAADLARRQAEIEAEAAAQAREEVILQAEAAARAREEARVQAEAAAQARAELARLQTPAADGMQIPEGAEDSGAVSLDTDAGAEAGAPDEEPESTAESTESAASPSMLAALEDLLGFSPVVGGVGLVGVILILGGLIALMRRRGSSREDAEEDSFANPDDETSDPWEDESLLDDESFGGEGGDASAAADARDSKPAPRPAGMEPDVDEFDIGIDIDEELMRSLDEEPEPHPRLARADTAPDSAASGTKREPAAGPGEDSPRGGGVEEPSLVDLIESTPESDVGRRDSSRGTWPDRVAPDPARAARGASAAELGGVIGSGDEGRDRGRAALGGGESLAHDIDELQTKLDLAQTYIDMEDYDDARALLRDVQAEGDLEQRAIARYLTAKLP